MREPPTIRSMVIEIEASALLSSIWYSDGSGAAHGAEMPGVSDGWLIDEIKLNAEKTMVRISLTRRHPHD